LDTADPAPPPTSRLADEHKHVHDKKVTQPSRILPLLRWIGGKRLIVRRLLAFVPVDYAQRRYVEPFLGAAAMFLALRPTNACLADANQHLIQCYEAIRDNHELVAANLRTHAALDGASHYYAVRETYNRRPPSAAQAARFLYLNRTCFNGIFRVNTQGQFNVPYGYKTHPIFPDRDALRMVSQALSARGESRFLTEWA
jgi:DNA adenine methylase